MAINSNHHAGEAAAAQEPERIGLRFSLQQLMAKTALADIYQATDLRTTADVPPQPALLLLVNPTVSKLEGFSTAWQQILDRPAPAAAAYPDVIAYGEHNSHYWLALSNVSGTLLSQRISELDAGGIPLKTALETLNTIHQTLDSIQAGAYGYIEPGVLHYTDRGHYRVLNAPLVKVMQLLTSVRTGTINQLALHSAYLSPSVSVGDVPVTEDDTFSAASLLYILLCGQPPFGEQSTLTAVAHGDRPLPLKKLKKDQWEAIEQALTYQRSARPENPEKFLALLKPSSRTKLLFPLAVLAAMGVIVFAGQHLVNRLTTYLPANGPNSVQSGDNHALLSNQPDTAALPSTTPADQASSTRVQNPSPTPATATASSEIPARTTASSQSSAKTAKANQQQPDVSLTNDSTTPLAANQAANTATVSSVEALAPAVATEAVSSPAAADSTPTDSNAPANNADEGSATAAQPSSDPTETTLSNAAPDNTAATTNSDSTDSSSAERAAQQQAINQLLNQATATFNAGQLEDSDSGNPGTISLLRELAAQDADNPAINTLMAKVVEKKYQQAEQRLSAKKFAEAETLVQDSDRLIREFMLTNRLQRQVRMESKVNLLREEQAQVNDLLRDARTAIGLGLLSQNDGQDHALSYLRRVLFKQPANQAAVTLLAEITATRQQTAAQALNNGQLEQARTYLRESGQLIEKYKLTDLSTDQQTIETQYAALTGQNTTGGGNTTQAGNTVGNSDQTAQPETTRQQQEAAALQQAEAARQQQLQQQAQAEAEAARQQQLQQQAEAARQQQLQAEAAKQQQLQAEAARQQQLQAEAARQQQLQTEAARQQQLQAEAARQQQLQAEAARQQQLQAEAARQQQLQAEAARQQQLQAEAARQQQLQAQAARQRQLQQQQTQINDGFTMDENGFVIGEPPINPASANSTASNNAAPAALPVERLSPNSITIQEVELNTNGTAQTVPVWEDSNLPQIQPAEATIQTQQPVVTYNSESVQAQFDNFQAQADAINATFPTEDIIPELQEVPLSVIEGSLPE